MSRLLAHLFVTFLCIVACATNAQAQLAPIAYPTLPSLTGNEYFPLSYPVVNSPLYATTAQLKAYIGSGGGGSPGGSAGAIQYNSSGSFGGAVLTGLVLGNGASAPTAYGGTTCTNQAITVLSAAGAATCSSITTSFLAGGFLLTGANGGTGVNNGSNTLTVNGNTTLPAAPASTQCLHENSSGVISATGSDCTGATPVVFVGNTAGSANTYTIASPSPSGFALTDQYVVCGSISATNTGASTLNVNSTGATAIKKQTPAGLAALTGGELVASNTQYCFQYNATGTAYVLTTQLGSGVTKDAAAHTVTASEWAYGQVFDFTTSQTLTLPVATSLATNGGVFIKTEGNISVTLAPNSADGINGGTINTSVTIPGNLLTLVTTTATSGTTAFQVPLGPIAGSNVTITQGAGGTTTFAATGGGTAAPTIPQGRLTLTANTPVMAADATAQTTLRYDTYVGNQVPVYNGTSMVGLTIGSDEITMGLSATNHPASGFFDIFAISNSGTLALCTVAWTNATTRASAISLKNGVWTISAAPTHCFGGAAGATDLASSIGGANQATLLGCFATTTTAGQTAMQFAPAAAAGGTNNWFGLANAYNRTTYTSIMQDSNTAWAGTGTSTWGVADAGGTGSGLNNRISWMDCLGSSPTRGTYSANINPSGTNNGYVGVNLDSTSAAPTVVETVQQLSNNYVASLVPYHFLPTLGFHFAQLMEFSSSASVKFNITTPTMLLEREQ